MLISFSSKISRLQSVAYVSVANSGGSSAAYDGAGMTDVALGFPIMLDVLQGSVNNQKNGALEVDSVDFRRDVTR